MNSAFTAHLQSTLAEIDRSGLYKRERVITTHQTAHIAIASGQKVLNLCANNYLGLADHPDLIAASHAALDRWGYGLASVRFIGQEIPVLYLQWLSTRANQYAPPGGIQGDPARGG